MAETEAPAAQPRFDPARRAAVTVALLLVSALASFEATVVSTAMPTIIGDLNGLPLYAWVFSAYLFAATVTMPIYGRVADIHGRRRMLLTAIVLFVGGAAACAAARSMPQLIAARVLQGLGAGGLMPVALIVLGDIYSLRERARIQGLFSSVWGVASLVGPLIGAAMTISFGWRSVFAINLPLGLLALGIVATQMIESRGSRKDPVDVAGAVTLALGVSGLLATVLQRAGGDPTPLGLRLALGLAGSGSLAVFGWLQSRRPHPLIPPALLKQPQTASAYLSSILLGTTVFGVDTFVPLFVQGARGGTAVAAGAVVTPIMLLWAISASVAARTILTFGFRRNATAGSLLILVGFAGLVAAASLDATVSWISLSCALIGAGLGPMSMSQVLAIQHVTEESRRGVATSLVPFFRTVGGSLGVGALGAILAAGLTARLGSAANVAGELLSGRRSTVHASLAAPDALRQAIESSLLPVFWVLLALALVHVFVAARFPTQATRETPVA